MDEGGAQIGLFDVLRQRRVLVEKIPFTIGSAASADFRVQGPGVVPQHCVIRWKGNDPQLVLVEGGRDSVLNGKDFESGSIRWDDDYTLVLGNHCIVMRRCRRPDQWLATLDGEKWKTYEPRSKKVDGPFSSEELGTHLRALPDRGGGLLLLCEGLQTMGFHVNDVLSLLPGGKKGGEESGGGGQNGGGGGNGGEPEWMVTRDAGEFTCPACWLHFDRRDVMNIAVHPSLRGDTLLGEAAMQRFRATHFNERSQGVDAMGMPCTDIACPHCRRRLPHGFTDVPHHIFSIVGSPSSGKSYYLTVLVKMLQAELFKKFGVALGDADPEANGLLNQMKMKLFSAATPEEAHLAKTDLEADMYEELPRLGQKVKLPRPFIFNLSSRSDPEHDAALVFYDNAGEHFQPGRDGPDTPGAQHIASAAALFFLFSPLLSPEFRRRLVGVEDPLLLKKQVEEQQDLILSESNVRVKRLLGMGARERLNKPMALIVGQMDVWESLLPKPLEPVVRGGRLDLAAVARNSEVVRELLCDVDSSIVAAAEALCSDVCFFGVSALGHAPKEFEKEHGVRKIGPDPALLAPKMVEVPTLWALSRVTPGLVPVHPAS